MINCMIAGVGGQGTVLLSRLIGGAALSRGMDVRGAETIGMAQRGGSVVSHVRIGEGANAPLIPMGKADLIIAFEPGEAARAYPYLLKGGAMIVCDRALPPSAGTPDGKTYDGSEALAYVKARVARLTIVDGEALIQSIGGARALNVALLGVAVGEGLFPFSREDAEAAVAERVPARYLDMNLHALRAGIRLARDEE